MADYPNVVYNFLLITRNLSVGVLLCCKSSNLMVKSPIESRSVQLFLIKGQS